MSSHLLTITSRSFISLYLHVLTCSYFHFSSSHLRVFSSSRFLILPSSNLHAHILSRPLSLALLCQGLSSSSFFLSYGRGPCRPGTAIGQPFPNKWGSNVKTRGRITILHPRRQPCRAKWGSSVENCSKMTVLKFPRKPFRTKWSSSAQNGKFFSKFGWPGGTRSAINEVRVSKSVRGAPSHEIRFECQKLRENCDSEVSAVKMSVCMSKRFCVSKRLCVCVCM